MEVVFDVRNKKDYEILEGLLIFGESSLGDKRIKEAKSHLTFFFYKKDKNGTIII